MNDEAKEMLGHTELNDEQLQLMADIVRAGETLEALQTRLLTSTAIDPRWVSIGATDLQKGVMAWKRAVGRPRKF